MKLWLKYQLYRIHSLYYDIPNIGSLSDCYSYKNRFVILATRCFIRTAIAGTLIISKLI